LQEEGFGGNEEEGSTSGIDQGDRPEGCSIAQMFSDDST
jgi:hypothetical protein